MTAGIHTPDHSAQTAAELAAELGISTDALRKRWARTYGTPFHSDRPLHPDEVSALTSGRRPSASVRPHRAIRPAMSDSSVQVSAEPRRPAVRRPDPGAWLRSRRFVLVALWAAVVAQVFHTGAFFFFVFPIDQPLISLPLAAVFAFAVDLAGLIQTIHSRNKAYLQAFAGVHFAMNMLLHIRLAMQFDIRMDAWFWTDTGVLSAVLAFAVYSYGEIFTKE